MKSILITGGAGFIGSHTAYLLAQQGYKVIIIDKFKYKQQFNPSWATVIHGDFADKQLLKSIFIKYNIKAVMHFAADIEVNNSLQNPIDFYENNVSKTITLLKTMLLYNVKTCIFSSSAAVYGNPICIPIKENHPKKPINPYGKTKLIVEKILGDMNQAYELRYVALRYFNAAGAYPEKELGEPHKPETHLIPLIIESALQQKPFNIFGKDYSTKDGTCIRDYVHVRDIAQAHLLALQHLEKGNPSDIFNLGTNQGFSIKEIIKRVEKNCFKRIRINWKKRRKGDPPILIADPSHAQTILQWKPKFSDLEFIIKSVYSHANK